MSPYNGAKNEQQIKKSFMWLFDQAKGFSACERKAISQLAAVHQELHVEDGYIRPDVLGGSVIKDFLKHLDACATMLKAEIASRCYREKFTANYRMILPVSGRHYLSDILAASASRASEGYLCVNGDMHVLTSECQSTSKELRGALVALSNVLENWTIGDRSPRYTQVKRDDLRLALRVFDKAWVSFEREYVSALIEVEAKSRAPLIQAINLEKFIETPCGYMQPQLELFLDCISNLIAKVQMRHRRTDDKFGLDVLLSASSLTLEQGNRVTAVLATGVVDSFAALRTYLRTVDKQIEQTHPDLHLNPGLVEVLTAMRCNWTQFEVWGKIGSPNSALNSLVEVAKRAAQMVPGFQSMCEECDPELFLVLPRVLLLCFLNNTSEFQMILKKFLPRHACGVESASKTAGQKHGAPSSKAHTKMDALMCNYRDATEILRAAKPEGAASDANSCQDFTFDILIQRAILGTSYDRQQLYSSIQPASRATVSSSIDSFMLDLEGWSLELQRMSPETWNEFTALFVCCIGDEKPCAKTEKFRV